MPDILRDRAEQAIARYRADPDPAHLAILHQDGLPDLGRDLIMESVYSDRPEQARPYTERIDAWLSRGV